MWVKPTLLLAGCLMLTGPVIFAIGFFTKDLSVEVAGGFAAVVGLQMAHQWLGSWEDQRSDVQCYRH